MFKTRSQYPLRLAWLKAYLDESAPTFLNATASAVKAGYKARNEHSFAQIGYKNKKKYEAQISSWLDQHGYSEIRLKMKVLQLMDARETKFEKIRGAVNPEELPPNCRVVTSGSEGDTLLAIEIEALETQRRSLDMAFKVKGLYAPEKREHSGAVAVTLAFTDEDRALARKVIDAGIRELMESNAKNPA